MCKHTHTHTHTHTYMNKLNTFMLGMHATNFWKLITCPREKKAWPCNPCVLQCVAVCCSVFQRVAVCCSVLQCVAVRCSVLYCTALLQHVAACCIVLQRVAACCSVLQCVAVKWSKKEMRMSLLHYFRSLSLPVFKEIHWHKSQRLDNEIIIKSCFFWSLYYASFGNCGICKENLREENVSKCELCCSVPAR